MACNWHHKLTTIMLQQKVRYWAWVQMYFLFRWNWGETTLPVPLTFFRFISVQFDWFVRGLCERGLCERLHSLIYFWVVRLRFVHRAFICMWFDLFLRDLIEFLLFWHYVDDLCFIWARLIVFVRISYCLFWTLDILAVTERHNVDLSCRSRDWALITHYYVLYCTLHTYHMYIIIIYSNCIINLHYRYVDTCMR